MYLNVCRNRTVLTPFSIEPIARRDGFRLRGAARVKGGIDGTSFQIKVHVILV